MPVVTVIGGSDRPFFVPFSGSRTRTLGSQVERSFANVQTQHSHHDSVVGASNTSDLGHIASNTTEQVTQMGGTAQVGDNSLVNDNSGGSNRFQAGINDTIVGGNHDTISAVGNLQTQGGHNSQVSVNGSLTFLGGTGDTSIQSGNATIYGTSHSTYHYVGNNPGNTQLYFNEGQTQNANNVTFFDGRNKDVGHILFNASSSHGSLVAHAGNGDTIEGGASSDTITVNDMAHSDDSSVTMSGGNGAPNLFQFLNDKGGNYKITDFNSAAGNKVGVASAQMQNIQHFLKAATVSGGDTTISLDDHTKLTFLNDTHIKSSDFQGF